MEGKNEERKMNPIEVVDGYMEIKDSQGHKHNILVKRERIKRGRPVIKERTLRFEEWIKMIHPEIIEEYRLVRERNVK